MITFFRMLTFDQIMHIFLFLNVENSQKHCPFLVILKCSNLNAPVMHTADHKKVKDPILVQGIVLALILCGVVALVDVGYPEQNVCPHELKNLIDIHFGLTLLGPKKNIHNISYKIHTTSEDFFK